MRGYLSTITFVLVLLFTLASCGTTYISVDRSSSAEIYKDGKLIGKGKTTIPRMGIPRKIMLTAKEGGVEIGSLSARRRMDAVTILFGLITNYTGFIWAWRYPKELVIPVEYNEKHPRKSWDQWSGDKDSKWDK